MPDEENLLPDLEDELPPDGDEDAEGEQAGEGEQEPPEEPDKLAALEAEVERLRGLERLASDLRTSAGRIQALEARLQRESTDRDQVVEQINKQFGSVHELLSTVVDNIDETALDPATKAKVRDAYETSRRAAEQASLRREATNDALEQLKKQFPQMFAGETQNQGDPLTLRAQQIEASVIPMFEVMNLDPDADEYKPLWNDGANLIRQGKSPDEVRNFFRERLRQVAEEQTATDRRQATKSQAGRGSPRPAGPPMDFDARLRKAADSDIDEGVKLLRELGAI